MSAYDRRQESIDYLNRQSDQTNFETTQAQTNAAFTAALLAHDEGRMRLITNVPPADSVDAGTGGLEVSSQQKSLDRILELGREIWAGIERCRLLPADMRKGWHDRLAHMTNANCVEQTEALRAEVKGALDHSDRYIDYRQVSTNRDLEEELALLVSLLGSFWDTCKEVLARGQKIFIR